MYTGIIYKSKHLGVDYPAVIDVLELDENGQIIVTGQHDLQAEIDSYAEEVDINNIIKRCTNPEALSVLGDSSFYDTTLVSSDLNTAYADIQAKYDTAIKIYDSLTAEQKANFSSFADFMQNYEKIFNANPINNDNAQNNNNDKEVDK